MKIKLKELIDSITNDKKFELVNLDKGLLKHILWQYNLDVKRFTLVDAIVTAAYLMGVSRDHIIFKPFIWDEVTPGNERAATVAMLKKLFPEYL